MAPLNEDQLEQIRNERRQQILDAALKVFADNGIKLTKISMIAKEAGVSHGLVYHYFSSKEEVLFESLRELMGSSHELMEMINNYEGSPLEKIRYFTKFAFSQTNVHVFRVIFHVQKSNTEIPKEIKDLIDAQSQKYVKMMYPLIVQGQSCGEIIEENPEDLINLYLSTLSGILIEGDLDWFQEDMDRKVNLFLRMISTR